MCAARPVLRLPRRVLHVPTPPPPPQHPSPARHPAAPTVNRPGRPTASPGAWSISAISPGGIFKKTVAYQADIVISGRISVIYISLNISAKTPYQALADISQIY